MLASVVAAVGQVLTFDVQGTGTVTNNGYAGTPVANMRTNVGDNALNRTTLQWATAGNSFNSNTWNTTNTLNTATNFISFTAAPAAGFDLTLTSLSYAMNGSNTAPRTGQWGYSIDGGAFTLQPTFNLLQPTAVATSNWDFSDFTVANGSSVTFAFFAFGTTSINGGTSAASGTIRISNITGNDLILNGSLAASAIPEPATYGIMAAGAAGLVVFFRRRKSAGAPTIENS